MNRTVLLLGVLVAIVGLGIFMSSRQSADDRSFDDYEGNFAVADLESIGRIVLSNGRKYTVELKRTKEGWVVNDGPLARMGSLEPLLEAIQLVEIKYMPPAKAEEHIKWDISANGIQVDIYGKRDDLMKSYFVGGANFDNRKKG